MNLRQVTSSIVLTALIGSTSARSETPEERIRQLEQRLMQMEKRLSAAEARARSEKPRQNATRQAPASPAESTSTQATATPPSPNPIPERNENLEFGIVRENVATLSSRAMEIAVGIGYSKNASLLQDDRTLSSFVSARYGIFDGVELGVTLPYYYNYRYTQTSPTQLDSNRAASMGDTQVQLTALVSKETPTLPSVNVTVGTSIPTGATPYYFGTGYRSGGNPVDPLFGRQSRGEWAMFGNLQFVKTFDPIVLFAGFGVEYPFSTNHQGHEVEWPMRFNYNAGFSFIVSNTTTLGFALIGAYQGDVRVDGQRGKPTQSEPIAGRLTLTQRLAPNFYIEPSVGIGLSKDAPQLNATLVARKRF